VNEDKATRYNRLKRRVAIVSLAWSALVLAALLVTRATVAFRATAESLAARIAPTSWVPSVEVVLYVVLLSIANEIGSLPLGFYSGFALERRYGLSNERLRGWVLDQLKSFTVGLALAAAATSLLYAAVRFAPSRWWLPAGIVFALFIVSLSNLAPVVLLPLFYKIKPLDRGSLPARLESLAERAGARVLGAYEWGLGAKTKKGNAALAGLGSTRRILVSDTMLADYSDEEIEVILAHELAHHVHGDMWKAVALESGLILAGFYCAGRVLARAVGPLGLRGPEDVAGLPLLLLVAGAVSLLMMPVSHAMSRANERSADRFALEVTKNPTAFISAMRRLGAQNLAEDHPSKIVQWLFYSHPPVAERIATAQAFKA
jgi:STE24 endopeptidase